MQVDPRVTSYYEDHFRELGCNRNFPDAHSIYKSGHRRDQAFEIVFVFEHIKLRMRTFMYNVHCTCVFTSDVCKLLFYIFIAPRKPPKDEEAKRETGKRYIMKIHIWE